MKKFISLFSCIAIYFSAFSQITIRTGNMPSINDTIRYSVAPTLSTLNFTKTGANFNWQYDSLGLTNQDVYNFQGLFKTPYASLILNGLPIGSYGYKVSDSIGMGGFSMRDIYSFFQNTNGAYYGVGTAFTIPISGIPIKTGGVYSDKDEIYKFPLNYNDQDSTTFEVTTPIGSGFLNFGTFKQKGYRLNKVEGWGTITTPYASNVACLKIKSVIKEVDSLKLAIPGQNPISFGFPTERVEYKWLSLTEKIPMLEVVGTMVMGNFVPNQIKYRDNYRKANASPLAPKVKFEADKYSGNITSDTFYLNNLTSPNIGTSYEWTLTPSSGFNYVKGTNNKSKNPIIVFNSAGNYTVKLMAQNIFGSSDSTAIQMLKIGNANSIQTVSTHTSFFYPNPVNNKIHFNTNNTLGATVKIFTSDGKLIRSEVIDSSNTINVSRLSQGNYIIIISQGNNIETQTFIKQ